nr:CinA family protein [Streptomyces rubellomurinus]
MTAALAASGHTVAVAESLTAGRLAAALADAPGAGETFLGGVVAYATDVKARVLHVDAALLARAGAVDPQVAAQMARGARAVTGATYGLATTGVAGPAPQDGQPVGTVYVAVAHPHGCRTTEPTAPSTRPDDIRDAAVTAALQLLHDQLRPGP